MIDFPQAVDPNANPNARLGLRRDVERVGKYFARYGAETDARQLAGGLWKKCVTCGEFSPLPRHLFEGEERG